MTVAGRIGGFLALAAPMIVSRAGLAGMGIADGLMVARHSAGELAVLGLSEGTMGRVVDVLVAFLASGMVLVAHAQAASRPQQAGAIWRHAMALALGLGALAAISGAAGWWLLLRSGAVEERSQLVAAAFPVVVALAVATPAALVALVSGMFLEAVGRAQTVAIAIIAANVANVGFNLVLIDGGFGIPALGALGSAISTGIVRLLLALGLVACVWTSDPQAELGVRRRSDENWRSLCPQRRLGYGAASAAAAMNLVAMGVTVLAGWVGVVPLAAITALWNALSAGLLLALGMADATAIRVAAAHGRGTGALATGALGMAVSFATIALLAAFVMITPGTIAGLYAPSAPLGPALTQLLPLGASVLICDSAVIVAAAALRGVGDVTWPTLIQIGTGICLLPLAWWLALVLGGGALGLVQAILLTSLLRAAMLTIRFISRTGGLRLLLSPQAT